MKNLYTERKDRVIKRDKRFNHVMALTLNPKTNYKDGVIRCITSRTGPEGFMGQIDRSVLHKVVGTSLTKFKIVEELKIKNKEKIIKELVGTEFDFLGLEDPDIWLDEKTNLLHLYFTLPLVDRNKKKTEIHIGHAVGKDLDNLVMTTPVLLADKKGGAKELSVVPVNKKGIRYNLVESSEKIGDTYYSTVRVAITEDMSKSWKFGKTVFNPANHSLRWIAGHASPGPLFPTSFIDVGDGKRVGIINGCVANKKVGKNIKYGTFSVGLFIYDYEKGVIDWVSPKPFIQDSEVGNIRAITFASQFVETKKGKGILYAHVDDSFVRAYELDANLVLELLPKK